MGSLSKLVLDKIAALPSSEAAADFFGVPETILGAWQSAPELITVAAIEKVFDFSALVPKVGDASTDSRKVCILLPAYKSTNPVTSFSLLSLIDRTKMAVMLDFGDAFIAHSRNKLACAFLKSSQEWALTVDDDMVLPCGKADWFNQFTDMRLPERFAGFNTVDRLLSHGKTLVGALYFGRWKSAKPVYSEAASDPTEEAWVRRGPHDQCKPTKWVGTGCMLIHRSVFLDIEKKFPHLARNEAGEFGNWFTSSEHDLKNAAMEAMQVLDDNAVSESARIARVSKMLGEAQHRSRFNSSLGMGEDVQFCVRAMQAGHQPHVDLGLICGHIGSFVYGPQKAGWVK